MLKFNDYVLYTILSFGLLSGCASANKPVGSDGSLISKSEEIDKCVVFKNSICTTDVHPTKKMLVTAASDGKVELWHWQHDKTISLPHPSGVPTATFSNNGKWVATGSYDNLIRLWNVESGELINTFEGHQGWITNLVFSSNDEYLASSSSDDTAIIWYLKSNSKKQLVKHEGDVWGLSFTPDNMQLLTGGEDNHINIWDTESGQHINTLTDHTGAVLTLAFSNNGRWLASGGDDYTIKLWDTTNWQVIRTLDDDSYSIYDLEFSPDDKVLISGGRDKGLLGEFLQYHWGYQGANNDISLRVWQPETGKILQRVIGHDNDVDTINFTPNGKQIVSSAVDGKVLVWDLIH